MWANLSIYNLGVYIYFTDFSNHIQSIDQSIIELNELNFEVEDSFTCTDNYKKAEQEFIDREMPHYFDHSSVFCAKNKRFSL